MLCSVTPICSAMVMNRLLKISSRIGSQSRADRDLPRQRLDTVEQEMVARRDLQLQPGSTTTVVVAPQISAGPGTRSPGRKRLAGEDRGRRSVRAG